MSAEQRPPTPEPDEQNVHSFAHPTDMVSSVVSSLAGMFLEEQLAKGYTIEIPSLGITLSPENLRSATPPAYEEPLFADPDWKPQQAVSLAELTRQYLHGEIDLDTYLAQERNLTHHFGEYLNDFDVSK